MTPRHYVMIAGVAVAAWLALFGDKTPSGQIAEPVVRPAAGQAASPPAAPARAEESHAGSTGKNKQKPEPVILALRPREELIGGASSGDKADAKTAGLFGSQSWVPPPPPPPKPPPPPPPTAPALPFTYLGKKIEDDTWEVYLARGEHTFIVRENSVIEQTYRIDSIKPPVLTLTYLPLNQMQTLTIGSAE